MLALQVPAHAAVRNRLLAAIPADSYERLSPALEVMQFDLGQVLIEAHQSIEYVYFPLSGIVSTVAQTEDGRIEIGIVGREGLVGLSTILGVSQSPHTSFVQGVGEALRIRTEDLKQAMAREPQVARICYLYIQVFMIQMGQTIYANAAFNLEARLARWILMIHDRIDGEEMFLTHGFLAAMLGVQRSGVTSATHILEGSGLIRNRRGRITVYDRDRLMELAGDAYQLAESEYERLLAEA